VDRVTVLAPPLNEIEATPYPADLLPERGSGLCLFAAAFLGANDAIHFARKDMLGTCIDVDARRLEKMAALYPDDWTFLAADAWGMAAMFRVWGMMWNVVSVDTFLGDATERSLASLDLWCALASRMVTATIRRGQEYTVPE
jgi:hypothetical protein